MPKSYREEFITGPKNKFTKESVKDVLLNGNAAQKKSDVETLNQVECRSPLDEFNVSIPTLPTTEQELATYELLNADSILVTLISVSDPGKFGRSRSERLNLHYQFPEGSNSYLWKYDSLEDSIVLMHVTETNDPCIQAFLGDSSNTPAYIVLERVRFRTDLLVSAKSACPGLMGKFIKETPENISQFLAKIKEKAHTWEHPSGEEKMPVVDIKYDYQNTLTLDVKSQINCIKKNMNISQPTISVGPLRVRFKTNQPASKTSNNLTDLLPRVTDLSELVTKLRDVLNIATTNIKLVVRGYADKQGQTEYNLDLSKRRAEWLKLILTQEFGDKINEISVRGCGDEYAPDSPKDDQRFRVAVVEIIPIAE